MAVYLQSALHAITPWGTSITSQSKCTGVELVLHLAQQLYFFSTCFIQSNIRQTANISIISEGLLPCTIKTTSQKAQLCRKQCVSN